MYNGKREKAKKEKAEGSEEKRKGKGETEWQWQSRDLKSELWQFSYQVTAMCALGSVIQFLLIE